MENMKTISQDESTTLPDDLIMENILPRLPIKSIIRCKSVSKLWLSTLSSPHFAKIQLKFASSSPQFLLFLDPQYPPSRVVSLSLDECNRGNELVDMNFTYNGRDIYVVGSCNGLVCLHDKHDQFCLWNPVTCHYHYVSVPDHDEDEKVIAVGFGYLPSIDDYKIACLLPSDHGSTINVYIYSWITAKWDKMTSFDKIGINIAGGEASVVFNDTLYWPPIVNLENSNPIVGVNLLNGKLTKLPMLGTFSGRSVDSVKMLRLKGRLSFCCTQPRLSVVWTLKRNGLGWIKVYEVYPRDNMDYLHSTESGKLLIAKDSQLMLLDPSQVFLKEFAEEGPFLDGSVAHTLEYKESLISPFGTVSAENEDNN